MVRKSNCPFISFFSGGGGGGEQHERPKHGSIFSITNAIYFSFIGILHNCNSENEAAAGKDIRAQIKKKTLELIIYFRMAT